MFTELPDAACAPAAQFLAAYYESDHRSAYDNPQIPLNTRLLAHVAAHALDLCATTPDDGPLFEHALYQVGVVGHRLEGPSWWWVAAELLDFVLAQNTDVFSDEMKNELARSHIACETIYRHERTQDPPAIEGLPRSVERAKRAVVASGLADPLSAADQPLQIVPHLQADPPLLRVRHWVIDADPTALLAVSRAVHEVNYAFGAGKVVVERDGSVSAEVAVPDSAATLGCLWDSANLARFLADSCRDALLSAKADG